MDRRTFMKTAALAPAAVGGLIASGAAATPSPDPVHQAYPVTYGTVLCFLDPRKCGCGWMDHKATGPLALKGSYYEMIRPAQAPAPHDSKQR